MKYGLVSHDSVATSDEIIIFGGATGGDFNNNQVRLAKGKVTYEKGHNAVGCACCFDEKGYYVVGGVSGPESLNGVVIYRRDHDKWENINKSFLGFPYFYLLGLIFILFYEPGIEALFDKRRLFAVLPNSRSLVFGLEHLSS